MPAAKWDIEIEENVQFDFYITREDNACVPVDVTGYGAKFQIRAERLSTSTVIYQAIIASGITIPVGTDGLFVISLTITQVNTPGGGAWTKAFYDFVIWPPGSSETDGAKRLVEGRVVFDPAAVHP